MSDENWARFAFRISAGRLSASQIAELMGSSPESVRDGVWVHELTEDSGTPLPEQFRVVEEYLRAKLPELTELAGHEMDLMLSWTPRSPQDGLAYRASLVRLLASVGAEIFLDTYLD
jgi:hypothetical protein